MIALNKEWLANLRVREEAEKYRDKGYISQAEFDIVRSKYPAGFYTPNVFVRIGLFILTFFVVLVGDGLMSLVISSGGNILDSPGWPLFLGVLSYIGLETLIATKHHFRSGVDDALLLATVLLSAATVFSLVLKLGIPENAQSQWIALGIFIFTLYFTIRFNDILMAAACCCAFLATVFFAWNNAGFGGLYTAPFVIIVMSAGVYWLTTKLSAAKQYIDYEGGLLIGQTLSLVALYAAGNYYIVQILGGELNLGRPADKPLPLGAFFWSWTLLVPLAYVVIGIRKKDAIFLRLGLLLIVAAVATFRNYYHILPTDIMLTTAGVLVTGISWTIIRYLKTPKHRFTYEEADEQIMLGHAQIESIITAQSVAGITATPPASGSRFGGGDGGGGGASGSF
jgi:hypothetical protein